MDRRAFLQLAAGAGVAPIATGLASRVALAQTFPTRPIPLVLPFPPGPVIVENQPGAGGSLAAASVSRARPDGYTIFLGSSSIHLAELILRTRPLLDPLKDLMPLSVVATAGF